LVVDFEPGAEVIETRRTPGEQNKYLGDMMVI